MIVLWNVGGWYKRQHRARGQAPAGAAYGADPVATHASSARSSCSSRSIFSKFFYMASLSSYYTFYLIEKFGVSVQTRADPTSSFSSLSVAGGTLIGGPIGDRFGRKYVIWVSILGVLPFTLALPHVGLVGTVVLTVIIGFVLASAFSAIIVFAQELMPGKIGMISGLFFGLAFGMGGLGAAVLGALADKTSIDLRLSRVCAFLPAIGLLDDLPAQHRGAARQTGASGTTGSEAVDDPNPCVLGGSCPRPICSTSRRASSNSYWPAATSTRRAHPPPGGRSRP